MRAAAVKAIVPFGIALTALLVALPVAAQKQRMPWEPPAEEKPAEGEASEAQESGVHMLEPSDTPVFLERLEVEIVNLDVVVTDRKGNPVRGLTRDDFTLRVDGEPTSIDNFYAVEPEPAAAAPAVETVAVEPAAVETVAEEPAEAQAESPPSEALPEPEQELHVMVLFDNLYATPGERLRVVKDLANWFENGLGPRRRAAVGYYNGGIRIHQPFTTDGATVASAIRHTAESQQVGYGDDLERRMLLRELEEIHFGQEPLPGPGGAGPGLPVGGAQTGSAARDAETLLRAIEAHAEHEAVGVRRRLMALSWQVDALAGLPGRKALLYITSGLDLKPGQELFTAWQNKLGELGRASGEVAPVISASNMQVAAGGPDLVEMLRELTRRANAGGVALYAIGTAGTGTSHAISAEHGGFDMSAISTSTGGRVLDQGTDALANANLGSGLERMADDTGGEAITGGADYDLIAETIEKDASHRYSLGFRPPDVEPGSRHRIEVEVPGREVRVRHRREFVTTTPIERASKRTLAALQWDRADNPIGIAADFGPVQPSEQGKNLFVLPVLVKVPFVNLVLLPESPYLHGQITIFVAVEDEKGRLSPVQSIPAPITIPAERHQDALTGVAGYRVGLVLRPGIHRLAIGVRDEVGDAVSSLVVEHDVVPPSGEA